MGRQGQQEALRAPDVTEKFIIRIHKYNKGALKVPVMREVEDWAMLEVGEGMGEAWPVGSHSPLWVGYGNDQVPQSCTMGSCAWAPTCLPSQLLPV